ncbi:MAG: DUF2232 domain-containing protein [Candidatus Binatia bacterium]
MPVAVQLAVASGLSAALYGLAVSVPPAATPLVLFVPLPGLFLATRAPASECGLWFILSTGAVTVAFGAVAGAGFALPFGLPTLVLGAGIRRFLSLERVVLAGVATWCVGIVCVSLLAYGNAGAVVEATRAQLAHSVDLALSTYKSFGASEHIRILEGERDTLISGLLTIVPALVVLTGAVVTLANLMVLRRWVGPYRSVNLRLWRTPDGLIWGLIATGFGLFVPSPAVRLVAGNLLIVILGCYFCQGLAIVSYYLERFHLPRGVRIAGYVLIAVQHVVAAMVLALGIFDLWGNFRRSSAGPADVQFHTDGE